MKKQKFKYRNANKQKGIILRSIDGGPSLFRIYGKNHSFKDYEILHQDIQVQILDDSAEFLESMDGETFVLDYSRKVLGQDAKHNRTKKKKAKKSKR
jgi:hypothetical protein